MSILDADFATGQTPVGTDEGIRFSPARRPEREPSDLRTLYERELARADREQARAEAAEARCEELRLAEVAARSDAGSWKSRFGKCRSKLTTVEEEIKELRRAVKAGAPGLHREVERLRKELSKALSGPSAASRASEHRIGALRAENRQLHKAMERAESHKETIRTLNAEIVRLSAELRRQRDDNKTIRLVSEKAKGKLEARLAALQGTVGATLSKLPDDQALQLRAVLRRLRHQKNAIGRLRKENARLRKTRTGLRNRIEVLEDQIARHRATGSVLSKRLYGRTSEQQKKPRSERGRGQQRGAPGHGRTQRPGIEERPEVHTPSPEACVCAQCGQPYAPNGVEESTLVEIEVKAHKRVIQRERFRRSCACASSPIEVSAPPVPRLFRGTPYGISFWARFLFELCVCLRPVRRISAWMSAHGLAVSPGTLANSLKRFVPLFLPLFEAILAHQNEAILRHADETAWRVRELGGDDRSSRAWLWTSVSHDAVCFHIDATRSAEAAEKLFAGILPNTVIVCDRYVAYKKLVRMLGGLVILAFCWSHMRRDFIEAAAGQARLTQWCQGWIERIAEIYRLNDERLKHYDPDLKRQTSAFDAAQTALKGALDTLFAQAERELAALSDNAREAGALRSLVNHWDGLCVFVDRPCVPLDNNFAERILRGPAIGRLLSHGSDSLQGAEFTATLYSVAITLSMNGIDVLRWLEAWLTACAENGGKPPGGPGTLAAVVDERGTQAQVHGTGMTGAVECRYYGRDFTVEEMALLRALIAAEPQPNRAGALAGVLPAHRLAQARRRPQGHDGPGHHARHAPRRRDRPAAAERAAQPAASNRVRTGYRAAAASGPDDPRRGPPARPPPRRARDPRGPALERVRRPLPLSRLQDPGRRPDALRRP